MLKISKEEGNLIKNGNVELLRKCLETLDASIIKSLKNNKDDMRFYQGASSVVDSLIRTLST